MQLSFLWYYLISIIEFSYGDFLSNDITLGFDFRNVSDTSIRERLIIIKK